MLAALLTLQTALAAAPTWAQPGLVSVDGVSTSLVEQAGGERLVVVVMKGAWCAVCADQLARLQARAGDLDALGVRVVGVSSDAGAALAPIEARVGWPILSDPGLGHLQAWDLWLEDRGWAMPGMVVYDRCGEVRALQAGRAPGRFPDDALFAFLRELDAEPEPCGVHQS